MRLIIKDYLDTFKEKDELDFLICNILTADGYKLNSIPKTGYKQYGVDIHAENDNEILLIAVKKNNIDSSSWDSNKNSVRPTLNEIRDSYFNIYHIKEKSKKIKIILANNGYINPDITTQWEGYINSNKSDNIDYENWNIDDLVNKCISILFNEILFTKELQSDLRKVLYFLDEDNFSNRYFEIIVDKYLENIDLNSNKNKIKKHIISFYTCISLINKYAIDLKIFKISINIIEYSIIKYWELINKNNLFEKYIYIDYLYKLCDLYNQSNYLFLSEISSISKIYNSFNISNFVENRIIIYDVLSRLSVFGLYLLDNDTLYSDTIQPIYYTLYDILNNNSIYQYPVYDNNAIEISMVLLFFYKWYTIKKEDYIIDDIKNMINNIVDGIIVRYKYDGKIFSFSDSYDEVLDIEINNFKPNAKCSILFSVLLEWLVLLDERETYDILVRFINDNFKNITLQNWQIEYDKDDENSLYNYYTNKYGSANVIWLYDFDKLKDAIKEIDSKVNFLEFSFNKYSFPSISIIASRYFHYPVLPQFWRKYLK
uniref:hypothetical protein n=1 Tax=Brachyspira catarrhinii TaxID=2528966 RepID=UPI003F4B0023